MLPAHGDGGLCSQYGGVSQLWVWFGSALIGWMELWGKLKVVVTVKGKIIVNMLYSLMTVYSFKIKPCLK